MRLVGPLPSGPSAAGLLAALQASGLSVELREGGLWAHDEADLERVRRVWTRHRRDPDSPRWSRALRGQLARRERERLDARREQRERTRRAWRRERRLRRVEAARASSRPLTLGLLLVAGAGLALLPADPVALLPLLASAYWLHELGSQAEALRGTRRFAALVLLLVGVTWLAAFLAGVPGAVLSGLAFGLLGDTAARSRWDVASGLRLPRGLLPLMATWMLACSLGAARPDVLLSQCVGLASGLAVGALSGIRRGWRAGPAA